MLPSAGSACVGAFAGDAMSRSVRLSRCQAVRHVLVHEMLVRRGHSLPPSEGRRNAITSRRRSKEPKSDNRSFCASRGTPGHPASGRRAMNTGWKASSSCVSPGTSRGSKPTRSSRWSHVCSGKRPST